MIFQVVAGPSFVSPRRVPAAEVRGPAGVAALPAAKPQGAHRARKTSLAKQPDPATVLRGRLKAAEPPARGRAKDARDAPLVSSLSGGQRRRGVIAPRNAGEGR